MWFRSERNLCRWTFFCKYYFSPASLSNFFSSILLAHLPSTRLSCARQRLFVTGRYAMGTCWHQKHDWIITPKWTNRFGRYCFNGKLTTHDVLFLDAASVALQPKLAAHVYLLHRYFFSIHLCFRTRTSSTSKDSYSRFDIWENWGAAQDTSFCQPLHARAIGLFPTSFGKLRTLRTMSFDWSGRCLPSTCDPLKLIKTKTRRGITLIKV